MDRILTIITVLLALSTGAGAETLYSRHGWWQIAFNTLQSGEVVCHASTTYTGGTFLSMGAKYGAAGERVWGLNLSSPEWRWIKNETNYTVTLYAPSGARTVTLRGTVSDHSLFAFVDKEVINALAMDRNGRVVTMVAGNRMLGTFRLDDSAAAIRDVVHCLSANPPVKTIAVPSEKSEKSEKKEESGPSSGTGFFVAPQYVLTNMHVIKGCKEGMIRYPDYRAERAYIAGADQTNDLALLRTEMRHKGIASFRFGPRLGEASYAYGFPLPGLLSTSGNFTLGNVTALTGINDDTRVLQTSTPVQQGNSGGPLLDDRAAVIGIVEQKLNALMVALNTGDVPQNVNFAIQSPIAVNFLAIKGVSPSLSKAEKKLDPADIAERAREFTVQVICNN